MCKQNHYGHYILFRIKQNRIIWVLIFVNNNKMNTKYALHILSGFRNAYRIFSSENWVKERETHYGFFQSLVQFAWLFFFYRHYKNETIQQSTIHNTSINCKENAIILITTLVNSHDVYKQYFSHPSEQNIIYRHYSFFGGKQKYHQWNSWIALFDCFRLAHVHKQVYPKKVFGHIIHLRI